MNWAQYAGKCPGCNAVVVRLGDDIVHVRRIIWVKWMKRGFVLTARRCGKRR